MSSQEIVYVAFLNAEGYSKVEGVFNCFSDAYDVCKKRAKEYANELFPENYEYEKIYYSEKSVSVDTFNWKVVESKFIK